jgi:hypothetical protein
MERNKLSYRELHGAIETLLRTHVSAAVCARHLGI